MNHSFNVQIAQLYGINEAILIENLYYWIQKNKVNGRHDYDGRTWTYNSIKAFGELFPYMSEKQIRYALNKLEEAGVVMKGNYNNDRYKQTLWYSLSDRIMAFYSNEEQGQKVQVDNDKRDTSICTKGINGSVQKGQMYKGTDINTDVNTDVNGAAAGPVIPHLKIAFNKLTKQEFKEQCQFFKDRYAQELINGFFKWWTPPDPRGKMKFQLQGTWDIEARLETWAEKQKEIDNRTNTKNESNLRTITGRNTGADQLLAKTLAIATTVRKADDGR